MTTMTMSAGPSQFNPATARPHVSSPLAAGGTRPVPTRNLSFTPAFPTSRPLRPFPSLALSAPSRTGAPGARKPIKIIEPPANFKGAFVLNLTQAELSRQD